MRCPKCDMRITADQLRGQHCVYCYVMAQDVRSRGGQLAPAPVAAPAKVAVAAPAPASAPSAPVTTSSPDPDFPETMTELRNMRKNDLVVLAGDLELDADGTKDELVDRIAEELGI